MRERAPRPQLPRPDNQAFFPEKQAKHVNDWQAWARDKAGSDNLVAAIGYGSQVTGDPTPSSIHDFILVVKDYQAFHEHTIATEPAAYGKPRSAKWHTLLNRTGPSYYHSEATTADGDTVPLKYLVISEDDFVKGCSGTLSRRDRGRDRRGGFGLSIAARVQKVALDRVYWPEDGQTRRRLESAINTARTDGLWMALGAVGDTFTLDELATEYVAFSYKADFRVEKADKAQTIFQTGAEDYRAMLGTLLAKFGLSGIVRQINEGDEVRWAKHQSPTPDQYERRRKQLKRKAIIYNIPKNLATVGLRNSIAYVRDKAERTRTHNAHLQQDR